MRRARNQSVGACPLAIGLINIKKKNGCFGVWWPNRTPYDGASIPKRLFQGIEMYTSHRREIEDSP